MNTNTIEHLESLLLVSKADFDRRVTRDPNLSLAAKQEMFTSFLENMRPTAMKLKGIQDAIAEQKRRAEVKHEFDLYQDMRRRQTRGAA